MARSHSTSLYVAILVVAATAAVSVCGSTAQATAAEQQIAVPGTSETEAWISAEAEYLSGRKLVVVCARDAEEWRRELSDVGLPQSAESYYGFSVIHLGEMYLSPYVCEGLRLGRDTPARGKNALQVSWSVNVLIHESVHLGRSTNDEALAEACARTTLAGELHRLYGIAYNSPELKRLTAAATWFRRTQGRAYQGGTCPPSETR